VTHRYANANAALDLLYIDDLIGAIVALLKMAAIGDFNVGTGVLTSTAAIAAMLRELIGGDIEIVSVPIAEDVACIAMDSRKAFDMSGWSPTVSVKDGVVRLLSDLNEKER
jgi:nucleoside-diphosphate-sugar epimerase